MNSSWTRTVRVFSINFLPKLWDQTETKSDFILLVLGHFSCFADHPELLIEVKNRRGTDCANFLDLNTWLFTCSVLLELFHQRRVHAWDRRVCEHVVFDKDVCCPVRDINVSVQRILIHETEFSEFDHRTTPHRWMTSTLTVAACDG